MFGMDQVCMAWSNTKDLADQSYRVQYTIEQAAFSDKGEYEKEKVL